MNFEEEKMMNTVSTMSARQLQDGIKRGMTRDDFCIKFNCTALQFDERAFKLYGHSEKDAKEIFSALKANEKRVKHRKNAGKKAEAFKSNEDARELAQALSDKFSLEELRRQETRLSDEIVAHETEYQGAMKEHRAYLENLRAIEDEANELWKKILDARERHRQVVVIDDECVKRMNEISAERKPKVEKLAEIRAQIEELQTLTLEVYDSGEISVLDHAGFALDDTGYEELYAKFRDDPGYEELRVKDIKVLARLVCIAEHTDRNVVLVCDRPEVEAMFQQLVTK